MTDKTVCNACAAAAVVPVLDMGELPVAHRYLKAPDPSERLFKLDLGLCEACGLAQIIMPIPPDILYDYYNFNFSSWKAEPHIADEIAMTMTRGPFASALDIGCNDGTFLEALRAAGIERCCGIEPNTVPLARARDLGFAVVNAMISPEAVTTLTDAHGAFDLVSCRQALEHMPDTDIFFRSVRRALKPGGYLLIDVPDVEKNLVLGDASVLWEEHVNHFTGATLRNLMRRHGFEPLESRYFNFSGGTVAVLARDAGAGADLAPEDTASVAQATRAYGPKVLSYGERLRTALAAARARGDKVVLYGVGGRSTAATAILGLAPYLDGAIDDQAEKHGLYQPGSQRRIEGSDSLTGQSGRVLCLLAVNNENDDKVRARIQSLGIDAEAISIFGPTDIWAELARLETVLAGAG